MNIMHLIVAATVTDEFTDEYIRSALETHRQLYRRT
jgi:hypothetical protein